LAVTVPGCLELEMMHYVWQIMWCFVQLLFNNLGTSGRSTMGFDVAAVTTHTVLGSFAANAEVEAGSTEVIGSLNLLA
jgi:hypothetical protein